MNIRKWIMWMCAVLLATLAWGQQGSTHLSKLHFQNQSLSFGVISADDKPIERAYTFQNSSTDTIWITQVHTSCGCTTASYPSTKFAPQATGVITLGFNPHLRAGNQHQQAFVYTNVLGASAEAAVLQLVGQVTPTTDPYAGFPAKVGALRAKRNALNFKFEQQQAKCAETILCINSSSKALTLSAPAFSFLKFSTVPATIPAGAQAELQLVIDAALWKREMGTATTLLLPIYGFDKQEGQLKIEVLFLE